MFSYTGYCQHFFFIMRFDDTHMYQGFIRKYNIRRHLLFSGNFHTQLTQPLKQRFVLLGSTPEVFVFVFFDSFSVLGFFFSSRAIFMISTASGCNNISDWPVSFTNVYASLGKGQVSFFQKIMKDLAKTVNGDFSAAP